MQSTAPTAIENEYTPEEVLSVDARESDHDPEVQQLYDRPRPPVNSAVLPNSRRCVASGR